MRLSPVRWVLACLVGCALIAVTLLPPEATSSSLWPDAWASPMRSRESAMRWRSQAAAMHAHLVQADYAATRDRENAARAFGGHRENDKNPAIWFAPGISESLRRQVSDRIAAERAARGEWRGSGAVGVMVVDYSPDTLDGVKLPWSGLDRTSSVIVEPSAENGNRCVTVVRVRHLVLAGIKQLPAERLLEDGCAFTDAFGAPGPKIAEWLHATRYLFARRLSLKVDVAPKKSFIWLYDQGGVSSMQCRAGQDTACLTVVSGAVESPWLRSGPWNDRSVATPEESYETFDDVPDSDGSMLELLARDLGPARFQRVWRSQKSLADAYFDETGEPFAGWIRARLTSLYGPYRAGPAPTSQSAMLTAIAILILLAITVRFAPRPYTA